MREVTRSAKTSNADLSPLLVFADRMTSHRAQRGPAEQSGSRFLNCLLRASAPRRENGFSSVCIRVHPWLSAHLRLSRRRFCRGVSRLRVLHVFIHPVDHLGEGVEDGLASRVAVRFIGQRHVADGRAVPLQRHVESFRLDWERAGVVVGLAMHQQDWILHLVSEPEW